LIVSAITFHGGTNVIGYPWGSFNRVEAAGNGQYHSLEAPDFVAFDSLGQILKSQSGGPIKVRDSKNPIVEYQMGDISSTIYPVNGGLEDWAYGGGWDTYGDAAAVGECKPYTYALPEGFNQKDVANVRTAIYIVETDGSKMPSEKFLGSR
jgi:hypothetical protein